jgi:hypothetical protein
MACGRARSEKEASGEVAGCSGWELKIAQISSSKSTLDVQSIAGDTVLAGMLGCLPRAARMITILIGGASEFASFAGKFPADDIG